MNTGRLSLTGAGQAPTMKDEGSLRLDARYVMPNPFVGLRPFDTNESLLFFGRREQTIQLLERLHQTRLLAVVGSSGCGKSSLIRAGLIPKLKAGFLVEDRDRWFVAKMRPGDAPIRNLAASIIEAISDWGAAGDAESFVKAISEGGAQATLDHLARPLKDCDANLLLLVDQFEELFRFGLRSDDESKKDEATDFVSIILHLAEQRELPIYVTITMRSDFIGDSDNFYGLPEALNRSQYLVPRLTRQQRREAIEGPIRLMGGSIAPRLLDRLLNDVGDEADQLPVMQHAMMRTWEHWQQNKTDAIDLVDYEATGTLKDALSLDADKALKGMSEDETTITQWMFQALTDTDQRGRRIRRPALLSEIEGITGAGREQVLSIINRFQSEGRTFLDTSHNTGEGDRLVDISHESLIRQWKRLGNWVDEEAKSRAVYLRVVDTAVRHRAGQAKLWGNPDLQIALDWREQTQPNKPWAERYSPEFETAMAFLDKSKKHRYIKIALWALLIISIAAAIAYDFRRRHLAQVEEAQKDALAAKQDKDRESEEKRNAQALASDLRLQKEHELERIQEFLEGEPVVLPHPVVGEINLQQMPDGDVHLLNNWREKNVQVVEIPELGEGTRIEFFKGAVAQLRAALQEINKAGLHALIRSFDGPFKDDDGLSPYSLGIGFNINKRSIFATQSFLIREMREKLVPIFEKHGFEWGGSSSQKDPYFFQVAKIITN